MLKFHSWTYASLLLFAMEVGATLPPAAVDPHLDGSTSTRFTVSDVHLRPRDTLTLRGTPNQGEPAPVDYIDIQKQ